MDLATSLCSTEICALNMCRATEVRMSMLPNSWVCIPTRNSDWLMPWTSFAVVTGDGVDVGSASSGPSASATSG